MGEVIGEENVVPFQEPFCIVHKSTDVGSITAEELAIVIRSLDQNPSEEEVQDLMNDVDTDWNCSEVAELLTLMAQSFKETENEDEFKEAFNVFDKDQNGYISATELRNVMINLGEKLTEEEAQLMIKEADLDGDGQVNYEDFVQMMRAL
ncbi:hypothetical protein RND81_05G151700 [Saponaria officinalis]|uniref:EF-hand domain-containing protein n=1 Tax=Saponaria officinalis TaxID=3572 RepID=A0AAW1KYA4_SAPOF